MGKTTEIAWTDATFNPWWGCAKVSAGCKNCYAESFAKRTGHSVWGEAGERRVFGDKHWNEPRKWNREAEEAGVRRRAFCASMADVFEDHPVAARERPRLWSLIWDTGWVDWLLLTKRAENLAAMLPANYNRLGNVWLGVTAENQEAAEVRIPLLLSAGAAATVRFVSAEPLIGPLNIADLYDGAGGVIKPLVGLHWEPTEKGLTVRKPRGPRIDWVIVGGESGHHARSFNLDWARRIQRECSEAGVAFFMKQAGDAAQIGGGPDGLGGWRGAGNYGLPTDDPAIVRRLKPKGGDVSEWPEDLRVRQFPREART